MFHKAIKRMFYKACLKCSTHNLFLLVVCWTSYS